MEKHVFLSFDNVLVMIYCSVFKIYAPNLFHCPSLAVQILIKLVKFVFLSNSLIALYAILSMLAPNSTEMVSNEEQSFKETSSFSYRDPKI